jgi:hypothetical protein
MAAGVQQYTQHLLISDSFEDGAAIAHDWAADLPGGPGAKVQLDRHNGNGFISLTLPPNLDVAEAAVHRTIDLTSVRGQRIRLSARIRVPQPANANPYVRFSVAPAAGSQGYTDAADSSPLFTPSLLAGTWTTRHVVVDVSRTATRGDITLVLKGSGTAWFDDVRIATLGPSPATHAVQLSRALNDRLATLARALALVRYFHPSDQSADADWNTFSIQAMEDVLSAQETLPLQEILSRLFASIAPTVRFARPGDRSQLVLSRDPSATHLVRWHHTGLGLGTDGQGGEYISFRDGIDADESAGTYVRTMVSVPHPSTCRTAEIHAELPSAAGQTWLFVTLLLPGDRRSFIRQQVANQHGVQTVIARGEVPADTQQIQLGIYLDGRSSIEIGNILLRCDNGDSVSVNAQSTWELSRTRDLYRKEITACGSGACLAVRRTQAETEIQQNRDVVELDIGSDLRMLLPLAVWSDGKVTFPRVPAVDSRPLEHAIPDVSVRLAAAASVWGTLRWFYPYFGDQRLDWQAMLPRALDAAAAASTPESTHRMLSQLVAGLRDGHARVRHPARSMLGMLPVALRHVNDKLIIVGGLPEYIASIPVGSELVSMDGVPASKLYTSNYEIVSAATEWQRDYLASLYVSLGGIGTLKYLKLLTPAGQASEALLPLVPRQNFDEDIRASRPRSGAEVAPSIFYVDPMKLSRAALPALIQSLKGSQAVILDVRGYIKNEAFEFLAHFIQQSVPSPELRTPIASVLPSAVYQDQGWRLWPAMPHLDCRMIVLVDARAVSAAETLLQIIRDNHLATFIGEPSAGTNGNVNTFLVAGGFDVRFTGLRVSAPDGSTIQGHGITPDQLVHPTLEGIRDGRDEILEAGIAAARVPAPK